MRTPKGKESSFGQGEAPRGVMGEKELNLSKPLLWTDDTGPTVHLARFPGASMLQIPGHLSRAATWGVPHVSFPSRSILALGCFLGFFEREALKNPCNVITL